MAESSDGDLPRYSCEPSSSAGFDTRLMQCRLVPLPACTSPHDILIKVDAASYCHTDAVLASGGMPLTHASFPYLVATNTPAPFVSLPAGSLPSLFRVGDRVGVPGRSFHPVRNLF